MEDVNGNSLLRSVLIGGAAAVVVLALLIVRSGPTTTAGSVLSDLVLAAVTGTVVAIVAAVVDALRALHDGDSMSRLRLDAWGGMGEVRYEPATDAMTDRFDKFTDRARKVLTLAQDEAQRFNHNYIGTEHLLLGLVREGEGVAARVLENMNVELAKVRTAVEFIIGRGDRPVVGEVGLTPRAKRVIELAIDEARRLGHNYIGTEHLPLGLVREGEGIAAGVLESLGVNLDKVRHEVIRVLSQSSSAGPAAETRPPDTTDPSRSTRRLAGAVTGSMVFPFLRMGAVFCTR